MIDVEHFIMRYHDICDGFKAQTALAKHLHLISTRTVDARELTSRREPQTLVKILVKALQKAPLRASVSVGSLHKSSSLIDLEGRLNLSTGYQQGRKTVRIAKHT